MIAAWTWTSFWLVLHILGVIIAFGPTFAFGLITALGRKKPQHLAFAVEVTEVIAKRLTMPLAVLVPLFGTLLIFSAGHDLWRSEWLVVSIVLYAFAFFFSLFWMDPRVSRMLKMVQAMPAPAPAGGPAGAAPHGTAPGPAAGGPPAEMMALGKQLQIGGMLLSLLTVVILVLMVWKPGACLGPC